jgi:hypothetical protein
MVSYQTNDDFPFNTLKLGQPSPLQGGGSYFTKITGDEANILVQMPISKTRAGIVRTRKIAYCDLLYNADDSDFVSWIEKLEQRCRALIKEKSIWFTTDLEEDDIENMMTPVARMYRSGKSLLVRVHIDQGRGLDSPLKCGFYNDSEEQIDYQKIIASNSVIPLIMVDGIKFSSRSFDIILKMEQMMIVEDQPALATCMIKRNVIELKSEPAITEIIEEKLVPASEEATIELEDNVADDVAKCNSSQKPEITENVVEDKLGDIAINLEEVDLEPENSDEENDASSTAGSEETVDTLDSEYLEEKPKIKPVSVGEEITIDVELMETKENKETDSIQEIEIDTPVETQEEPISLKRPNEVYYEIYKAAREKAKEMKKAAMEAFLEAQQIKTKYMLDEIEDSDDELEVSST